MRPALSAAYTLAAHLATVATAVAPASSAKWLTSLRARRGLLGRYRAWADASRDTDRPLVWLHAPSVGEGLQARPIIERLRLVRPDLQLAYTHFSPSAAAFASRLDVDFRDYLPFDTRRSARAVIAALRPAALIFSKLDVWPVLTREADLGNVRLGLISATLAQESSRRGRIATSLLRDAYARLDMVGAIDAADAQRLVDLGVSPGVIEVTGDTRYDQVVARARAADRQSALLSPLASPRLTMVAGSTWPADERTLLAAWEVVRREGEPRLIVAPHEPTAAHLVPIERWADRAGLRCARLGAPDVRDADIIVVDRVGVLGELYALADIAFVGGGFHDAGLHSVLEPAAFGAPVMFGPRWNASRDAALLLEAGGAASVTSTEHCAGVLREWFANTSARTSAGRSARAVVQAGLGAADRTLQLVMRLLI